MICSLCAVTSPFSQSYFKRHHAESSEITERVSFRVTLEHECIEPGTLLDHLSILRCGEQTAVRCYSIIRRLFRIRRSLIGA